MTFWETVERGEYVMIALAVILIAIVCIWWVCAVKVKAGRKSYPVMMQRVRDHVMEGDIENSRQLSLSGNTPGGRVVAAGLNRVGASMPDINSAMVAVAEIEKNRMSRGQLWLRAFAVISPLLGLGGTLVGVVDRLRDLGEMGGIVDLSMICAQIAPTIVTTVAGLGVGIFSLIALTSLEATAEISRRAIDSLKMELNNLLNEPG